MKPVASSLLVLALASGAASAACTRPAAPGGFPDGSTAPREEMVAAFETVSGYNQSMTEYLDCIKLEHDASLEARQKEGEKLRSAEQREYHSRDLKKFQEDFAREHDGAYDEQLAVVASFNKQKEAFNARVKKEKEEEGEKGQ